MSDNLSFNHHPSNFGGREPNLRPSASDLLLHPFITCSNQESLSILSSSIRDSCNQKATYEKNSRKFSDSGRESTCTGHKDVSQVDSIRFSMVYPENLLKSDCYHGADDNDGDMCQIDDEDNFLAGASVKPQSLFASDDIQSFNPMCEPVDDWPCEFDEKLNLEKSRMNLSPDHTISRIMTSAEPSPKVEDEFSFSSEPLGAEDDDEVTESKIKAFLDEKAFELKKLQTPLYEEFFGISNETIPPAPVAIEPNDVSDVSNVTSKGRSPSQARRRFWMAGSANVASPGSHNKYRSKLSSSHSQPLQEIQPSELNESKETLHEAQLDSYGVNSSFSERQRKWEEELVEELERQRG